MCFRPPELDAIKPIDCESCGETIFPVDGILPLKCPFCRTELAASTISPPNPPFQKPVTPAMPKGPMAPPQAPPKAPPQAPPRANG